MFSLPSLAPQDSYSLWYTSSTTPHPSAFTTPPAQGAPSDAQAQQQHPQQHPRHRQTQRTPLSRLRQDEEYLALRKQNIQNYGSGWIKPPGVSKSLHQLREEKREMEEHQEALRREALAQELAEAEAAEMGNELLQGEDMGTEMGDMGRDLDDEVPDADEDANGTAGLLDSSDEGSDIEEEEEEGGGHMQDFPANVLASRLPDDVYREALVRGDEVRRSQFSGEGSVGDGEEAAGDLLQEEDLIHEHRHQQRQYDLDMDIDADLDADIPEASADGYEHTDTEEELSSSDDDGADESQISRHQAAMSMVRSDGTQNSMDLSNLMADSSEMGSPPRRASRRSASNRSAGRPS
ncbi:uncharacterized protein L3040_006630 [Drepanopeziza brunnea f. sp. 'multigermtubi']|uniref:Anaphase-promoting complex, subunit 15/MND2 n=1 Tax=Marssonina brunnea f. sp. multigermtubi (strain MB_m1) TaxID=1072389 RepID=K1XXI6_MARBU|nr:uncharacterized protein MBM_04375 [Drepanopeziza brunnea f. sp. 'multigermtubi' MB_m1]EKD17514.1 hypothetical protein MBM_04375 [Drepanopeziza brunnea f. sp. 'multigermtubi' MB_m1]KAJ5038957.1 hypothetical protein L3040_006630 [Drepanopeziza brunnea f. sp. 'multigermtubi']